MDTGLKICGSKDGDAELPVTGALLHTELEVAMELAAASVKSGKVPNT